MKLNKLMQFFILLCFVSCCFMLSGFTFFSKNKPEKVVIQQVENNKNDVWCITFQLVWNEFMDKITGGNPVILEGGNPPIADELNKKLYTKADISENSYYIETGKLSRSLKRKIEKNIRKKFREKSDILSMIDWNVKNSYLFYAMLKKEFKYYMPFQKLASSTFNASNDKVKYWGIKKNSDGEILYNLGVLFYNSPEDYAVKIYSKEKDDVILVRTPQDLSFDDLYSYVVKNTDVSTFTKSDELIVPEINVDKTISYDALCNKTILGTNYRISQALQTIKFKLDNEGGYVKSEAAMSVMRMALLPTSDEPRQFLFDKPFTLFLIEQDKDKPYFAMKIDNTDYLVKEN